MRTIDLRGIDLATADLRTLVPRPVVNVEVASQAAAELIAAVRERGSSALLDQSERFDGIRPPALRVPSEAILAAVDGLDPTVRAALDEAIVRVRKGSAAQVPPPQTTTFADGATVVQRWQPVDRAGLYVPGGKAPLASSVVMNVVPAQAAGVRSLALASPAQKEFGGLPHPTILAAAGLLGVDEVWAMGGAGAIGALAYGVPDAGLAPVQIITGPGNIYVAAAKRLVRGVVGIDSEAGTTEILIIADETASPALVAADLLSQAEHDEAAASVLVTDSTELADAVAEVLEQRAADTANSERAATALAGPQSAIILVEDEIVAAAISNAYGPEHLELHTVNPHATLANIADAGAIFLGGYSPVSLGDYMAGSNHVLPTGGAARYSAALGAYSFLRPQQVIEYDRAALAELHDRIVSLADAESLPAHGEAITARFEG
ncbi:histidinol dehydrogenase [Gryllotalpicola protaetiae]|uniref:Histidinol dehydrogenase n=1 Tax=Gryllotalpicola protaetiae TaxID=2419771 RepID=A0A387BKS9_9MICO|nr:histidinol dehydrogenase [Gryllotalpicola protaetiae]AYG04765.1 histidinol dehydrogenase [Gryllotalpicola protaetiae]